MSESATTRPTRRIFLRAAALAAGAATLAACAPAAPPTATTVPQSGNPAPAKPTEAPKPAAAAPTSAPAATAPAATAAPTATSAPAAAAPTTAPTIVTARYKEITLRQVGTGVSAYNEIRDQAMKDLGFKLEMKAVDTDTNVQLAITQKNQWDLYDGEFFSLPLVVPAGSLQGIDVKRIKEFDKIVPLFSTGKLTPQSKIAQGTAPHKVMFLKAADGKEFATEPTGFATLIPHQYNADTLGYRPDLTGGKIESWAQLFDAKYKGKTSILDIPSIGIMDAAMIAESAGLMKFGDKGDMTRDEIDKVTKILTDQKKAGQFRAFWKTFDESVNLMASGEVVLQSMWSPAVTAVKAKGIQCVYAPLKEGYRAWGGGFGINKNLSGMALDAAYDYLNWWLSGWPGAFIGRQGYYTSIPDNARKFMKPEEWDFWYEGKSAAIDMVDPFGTRLEPKGAVRDGGSFTERMGRVECWNSVMKEQAYLVRKWNEFIAA